MSFRRNSQKANHWHSWLEQHRAELLASGVPLLLLEDRHAWFYFLEHGDFTPLGSAEAIIDVDRLPRASAERLCLFLERDDSYPRSYTQRRLQSLLGRQTQTD